MKDINLKILVATLFLLSFSALAQDSLKLLASYDSLRTVYGGNIFGFYPIGVTPPVLNENQKEKITNCIESLYVNNIIPKHIKGKVILEIICDKTGVPVNITTLFEKPPNFNLGNEAKNALKSVIFIPAMRQNENVSIVFKFAITFEPPKKDSK
ncbi:MAG: hypothetical protein PHF33_11250 [Candidatus Delongbacteria bacterium]|jgi:hypothetical protein|nr:hypothetical protein [Candidatus Delongbacteria bacterium]MDD4206190.1 hypothetical protein [Candidatus Delongbacteria bacterium]MDY0017390.1 hypothetical protein [Candidatus Delongbacteria bacterium]